MKLPLLRAGSDLLTHIEKKFRFFGFHGNTAKKKHPAQLTGLFTKDGVRDMIDGSTYCLLDTVIPGSAESCDSIWMNLLCTEMNSRVLPNSRRGGWEESKLKKLRSEFWMFKSSIEKIVQSHRSSGMFTLSFDALYHLGDDLERFGSLCCIETEPLRRFNVF